MVVATLIPRFPLLIALLRARRPLDAAVALGPQPGSPQLVGLCTPAAAAHGVRPGLRVGEALARCPDLELVVPDPDAVAEAAERVLLALEAMGAAVEPLGPGVACFEARGLERLHGGLAGVLRRARTALPVGADGRLGAAPSRFAAVQAAREAPPRRPLAVGPGAEEVAAFLAPLPAARLPLSPDAHEALAALGLDTIAQVAALPRAAALDRFGREGLRAWLLARGGDDLPLRPRRPPDAFQSAFRFPEPVGARGALEAAARLLLAELAGVARARGRALRGLTLRARLEGGGSWTRTLALREATADPERLAAAALPCLAEVAAPVEALAVRADASGALGGRQLTLVETGADERARRAREAVRQVRAAQGDEAVLRLVEMEPWSSLPERQWALVPYEL
jgi:protein ImuB